jgi:hypothetical protein
MGHSKKQGKELDEAEELQQMPQAVVLVLSSSFFFMMLLSKLIGKRIA